MAQRDGEAGAPASGRRRSSESPWDSKNRRLTFYCPDDLREAIEAETEASGRSTTRVIVDALRAEMARVAKKRGS